MDLLKVILIVILLALLLVGAAVWTAGALGKNAGRKKLGIQVLGAWVILDFVCVILALCLGWFK